MFQCGARLDNLKYVQPVKVVPIGDPVPAITLNNKYTPTFTYSNERSSFAAPQSSFSAPQATYGAPSPSYAAPSPSYAAPSTTYGAPKPSYSATKAKPVYKKPSYSSGSSYAAPAVSSSYAAPAVSLSYAAPAVSSSYSAPSSGSFSSVSAPQISSGVTNSYGSGVSSSFGSGVSSSFGSGVTSSFGSGVTSSFGSGVSSSSSYTTGFSQQALSGSYTPQNRPVREGRIEECYCVSATQCPRHLVSGPTTKDYAALIDPRVKSSDSIIAAETDPDQ